MIYAKLIHLIEKSSLDLAQKWCLGIRESEYASTYQTFPEDELVQRSKDVFDNVGKWLDRDTTREEIGKQYVGLGRERYREGFPLCEIQYALFLTKKVLWNHIMSEGIMTNALEIYQALDLIVRFNNFYDMASFYIIRGYLEELYKGLKKTDKISREDMAHYFPKGSFYLDFDPDLY